MPTKHHAIPIPANQRTVMTPLRTLCGLSTGNELLGERVADLGRFDATRSDVCGACARAAANWAPASGSPDLLVLRAFD